MPICQSCTSAIEKSIRKAPIPQLIQAVIIQFLALAEFHLSSCWVCLKFSEWLKSEDLSLFNSWKTNPLRVKYFHHGQVKAQKRPNSALHLFVGITVDCKSPDGDEFCMIDLTLIPPGGLNGRIGNCPTVPEPGSLDFSLIKEWINTCRKSHKQCRNKQNTWYPTRLLHITSGGQKVRLITLQDHTPKGPYMTLSYRWGNFEYHRLQTSTMAQLQRNVVVPDLPPALQDAIKIAAFLDIHYLWIDALCIKQDKKDRSDWNIESLTMGKVYANACLNFSAVLAVDGHESMFHNQGWSIVSPSEARLKINGKTELYYLLDGDIWIDEISNAPLNNRGWVYQERFLAQRVLHFSTRQLGWECQELTALEMFPRGLPANTGMPVTKSWLHALLAKVARHTRRRSVQDWLTAWHDIVETYSRCSFTFTKDKLIAFAGIGARISESIGTELVAGMLVESLIYDLAWWRWMKDRYDFPLTVTSLRAPSWSWMSVDGQINFPGDLSGLKYARTFVKSIEIIRDPGDQLGQNSRLKLSGVSMPLTVKWSEGAITSFSFSELSACRFTVEDSYRGSSVYSDVAIEELRDLEKRGHVLLLPLFWTPTSFNCILITKHRGRGLYRRIGAIQIPVQEQLAGDGETQGGGEDTHLEQWFRDTTKTDKGFTNVWNYTALQLFDHIQSLSSQVFEIL